MQDAVMKILMLKFHFHPIILSSQSQKKKNQALQRMRPHYMESMNFELC